MFCPLSVDYGNVADWVAGISSIIAVCVALYIANGQRRYDQQQRVIAKNEEHERRAHLIAEVIRLAGAIEAQVSGGVGYMNAGAMLAGINAVKIELQGLRTQLEALQPLAMNYPQLFGEIGRIAHSSKLDDGLEKRQPAQVEGVYRTIADEMEKRRTALMKLSQ
ncbi:hypothetical protein ACKU27_02880 [Sphingobium yanoikuyae]|uniref:hypothetical protein n=1 Tax=Sphingobium yanoikuyae TaxID=13690 RepID=UPI003B91DD40